MPERLKTRIKATTDSLSSDNKIAVINQSLLIDSNEEGTADSS